MRFFPCVSPCGSEKFRPRTEKYLAWGVFGDPGRSRRRTPACTAPIGVGDPAAPLADIDNLKAALTGGNASGAFLSAASPGVISLFFRNDHYANQEAYLFAIAEAMRGEYEAIAAAGVMVQIDCPDLAMGRHIQYADLSVEEFRKRARLHIEALNHALAAIPPERVRMHLCWGNYEDPTIATCRWPRSSMSFSRRGRRR